MTRRCVDNFIRITSVHGSPAPGSKFSKHLGTDYSVPVNTPVKANVSGTIISTETSPLVGKQVHLQEDGNGRIWRYLHLNRQDVKVGQHVNEGQQIALSGNTGTLSTGPHCHNDCRKAGTKWDESFYNYYDPEKLIAEANKPIPKMPADGVMIQFLPSGGARTVFDPGTTNVVGHINPTDDTFKYLKRGTDPKYPYRMLLNTASGGGNGKAVALYRTDGTIISGWKTV